jgi:hypothetical protein
MKIKLGKIDKEGLEAGRKYVKQDWWHMVDVFRGCEEGKDLPYKERVGGVSLAPIKMDFAAIAPLMKEFLPAGFLDNANMASLILDEKGEHLVWGGIECCINGVYQWVEKIDVTEDWAKKVNPLLAKHDFKGAYKIMKGVVKEKFDIELGLIKVARVQFFIELAKTYDASKNGEDMIAWIPAAADFGKTIFTKDYINFYPVPYFFGLLRDLVVPMIEEFDANEITPLLRELVQGLKLNLLITISTKDKVSAFGLKQDGENIKVESIDQDLSDKLFERDIKKVAKNYMNKFQPDLVVSMGLTDDLKTLIKTILTKIPWDKDVYYMIGDFANKSIEELGKNVWIELKPSWISLDNILPWAEQMLHYDIRKIQLPMDLIVYGLITAFSDTPIGLFVINDERELVSSMLIDMSKDVPRIITPPKTEISEIFKEEKNTAEALQKVCLKLSDNYGKIYPCIAINIDVIKPLLTEGTDVLKEPRKGAFFALKVIGKLGNIMEEGLIFSRK